MRTCSKCGITKPQSDFPSFKRAKWNGRKCKRCVADYAIEWRKRHLERINRERKEYYYRKKDTPEYQAAHRRRTLRNDHGITPEEYDAMLLAQGGVCAICLREERARRGHKGNQQWRRLAVDHDHATGRVRGLLCSRCNLMLGWMEHKELIARVWAYMSNPK